ncbi:hypothetical protein AX17_004419 [Amanita inopinata Kibby_2008]|nr:hypothetical protein AX17_004419 [Amanita inopinata Kibby_2008]
MPLPALIRFGFECNNLKITLESRYYGAYNMLLLHAFPGSEGYVVQPQKAAPNASHNALASIMYLRVNFHGQPIFFVEIKPAMAIESLSERADADKHLRSRLECSLNQNPSKLYGLSAFGTKLCFYCLDKTTKSVTPPIPQNVNDKAAPVDWWNADILTDDAYSEFMGVVECVKALAVAEVS